MMIMMMMMSRVELNPESLRKEYKERVMGC
jgi:hypothetical protein